MHKTCATQCASKTKTLANTSLCQPILEYVNTVWDPVNKRVIYDIEVTQNKAVKFIANIKESTGVTEACSQLNLSYYRRGVEIIELGFCIKCCLKKHPT